MNEVWIASLAALWVLTLFLAFLLVGALRQIGIIQIRLGADPGALITRSGLERGSIAPDFVLVNVRTQQRVHLSSLPKRPTVLVFISTSCSACVSLVPHLNEVLATRGDDFEFVAICRGSMDACRALLSDTGLRAQLLHDAGGTTEMAYGVTLTPFTFVLDADRRVLVRGIANSWAQLESLLDQEGSLEPNPPAGTDAEPALMQE